MNSFRGILGQCWNSEFHKVKLLKFQSFKFDLKFLWNWSFFNYEKIMIFKKVLNNLEAEEQVHGIIMGVTCLFLLGPFYYIALIFTGVYRNMNHTVFSIKHRLKKSKALKTFCFGWILRSLVISWRNGFAMRNKGA